MDKLVNFRSLCWSAFRAGSLQSLAARPATWDPTRLVIVAGFSSPDRAAKWAWMWATRINRPVKMHHSGRFYAVAVPTCETASGKIGGVWIDGGLRGLCRRIKKNDFTPYYEIALGERS